MSGRLAVSPLVNGVFVCPGPLSTRPAPPLDNGRFAWVPDAVRAGVSERESCRYQLRGRQLSKSRELFQVRHHGGSYLNESSLGRETGFVISNRRSGAHDIRNAQNISHAAPDDRIAGAGTREAAHSIAPLEQRFTVNKPRRGFLNRCGIVGSGNKYP